MAPWAPSTGFLLRVLEPLRVLKDDVGNRVSPGFLIRPFKCLATNLYFMPPLALSVSLLSLLISSLSKDKPVESAARSITAPGATATHPSRDAQGREHAGFHVLQDMAVEQPVARIVGDEGDLDALLGVDEHRVQPFAARARPAVARSCPCGQVIYTKSR